MKTKPIVLLSTVIVVLALAGLACSVTIPEITEEVRSVATEVVSVLETEETKENPAINTYCKEGNERERGNYIDPLHIKEV